MTEVSGRPRAYAFFIIKILIVLILPLQGFFYSYGNGWFSILLTVNNDYFVVINPIYSLLAGILILLPCLIFEWRLNSQPISKSFRGKTVAACFLSWFFSLMLLPFRTSAWEPNSFDITITYTPILAIAFFVILPLISRETTMRSLSTENRDLSFRFITSTVSRKFRRGRILSGLLWFGLVFCPFMFFSFSYTWSFQIQLISLFYTVLAYVGDPVFGGLALVNIDVQFVAWDFISLPLVALLTSLRFIFVRDVFRYQSGYITKSRLVSVALLGELLPSAALTFLALLTFPLGSGLFPLFYPLPILSLIGFAFLRFSKFVPTKEELWLGYEHRMWFEKQDPHEPEPADESIKVPLTYLLLSQFRKRVKEWHGLFRIED